MCDWVVYVHVCICMCYLAFRALCLLKIIYSFWIKWTRLGNYARDGCLCIMFTWMLNWVSKLLDRFTKSRRRQLLLSYARPNTWPNFDFTSPLDFGSWTLYWRGNQSLLLRSFSPSLGFWLPNAWPIASRSSKHLSSLAAPPYFDSQTLNRKSDRTLAKLQP